jgi:hypothetical protein
MSGDESAELAASQMLEDAVERGWMEHAGVDAESRQLYRLTITGNEVFKAGFIDELQRAELVAAQTILGSTEVLVRSTLRGVDALVIEAGMVVVNRRGNAYILERRLDNDGGWWTVPGGGYLSDDELASDNWRLLDRTTLQRLWEGA